MFENCLLTTAAIGADANATFKKTDVKLYVPFVNLLTEENAKLAKQLNKEFKRPVDWNKYKVIDNKVLDIADANKEKHVIWFLDSSYQGVKRLYN